jgi:hypothetical protein
MVEVHIVSDPFPNIKAYNRFQKFWRPSTRPTLFNAFGKCPGVWRRVRERSATRATIALVIRNAFAAVRIFDRINNTIRYGGRQMPSLRLVDKYLRLHTKQEKLL